MKRLTRIVVVAVTSVLIGIVAHVQSQQRDTVGVFMRAKLEHSQNVLEGLTTEDFGMISKNAAKMELLSQEAAWQVLQTPEYRQQSLEFRRATTALKAAADNENIDGAALAYVDVTMKCVKCHQYVRNVKNASFEDGL